MEHSAEDKAILALLKDPDQKDRAYPLLIKQYKVRLYWHIRKMVIDHDDTDDILQTVWIKAWKGLDNFRSDSALFTWLYRIATNETITFLNRKRRMALLSFSEIDSELESKAEQNLLPNASEIERRLQKAILRLPDKQRLVFNMRYYDEVPYEEMSKILNTSEGALKASYHHAVKKVEKYLNGD